MSHEVDIAKDYYRYQGVKYNNFAQGVQTGIADNDKIFDQKTAPVNNIVLLALIATMMNDFSKYKKGGNEQKQIYLISRGFVMDALKKIAPWVKTIANGDAKIIILAGYKAAYATSSHKAVEEASPVKIIVNNTETSGTMTAECESYGVYHFYGCIMCEGKPLSFPVTIGPSGQIIFPIGSTNVIYLDMNHDRFKKFMDLTPGVKYWFYFYVVSTAGVTSLSQAVVKMCI